MARNWLVKALRKNSFAHGYRYAVTCGDLSGEGKATKTKKAAQRHAKRVLKKWGVRCRISKLTKSGR